MYSYSVARFKIAGAILLCSGFSLVRAAAGNVVLEWNHAVLVALKGDTSPPLVVARSLAIFHCAIREAVTKASEDDAEAAAIGAANVSASLLFPSHEAAFARLRQEELGRLGDSSRLHEALGRTERIAKDLIDSRTNDGSATQVSYIPQTEPGAWRRTPPSFRTPELPQWATQVKPFALDRADQFRPKGPPSLSSAAWAKAFDEIKALGDKNSPIRSEEQTLIARFWADFSSTETPPGHWNSIAHTIALDHNLSLSECANLFAALNVAMVDAGIACWEAKYHYNFWRPVTAIRRADEEANVQTQPQPEWLPLLPTPPHPEYPSAHSAFSGAAAIVLANFLGTDSVTFTVRSDTVPAAERTFSSLWACAEECGVSRTYAGIHYRFSCEDGLELGKAVGEWILRRDRANAGRKE